MDFAALSSVAWLRVAVGLACTLVAGTAREDALNKLYVACSGGGNIKVLSINGTFGPPKPSPARRSWAATRAWCSLLARALTAVQVTLNITGTSDVYNGDLYAYLTNGTGSAVLGNRDIDQRPRLDLPPGASADFSQGAQEKATVKVIAEDRLLPVATRHHVVKRPGILQPNAACHAARLDLRFPRCQ